MLMSRIRGSEDWSQVLVCQTAAELRKKREHDNANKRQEKIETRGQTNLIAGESQNFKSFILVGLIKGLKLGVVDVGLASLGGNVHHKANFS